MIDPLPRIAIHLYDDIPSATDSILKHIESEWFNGQPSEWFNCQTCEFNKEKLLKDVTEEYDKGKNVGIYLLSKPFFYLCKFVQTDVDFHDYDAHDVKCESEIKADFAEDSLDILNYCVVTEDE